MPAYAQRFIAFLLTVLLVGQSALAGSGGLYLCLPSTGGTLRAFANCGDLELGLCRNVLAQDTAQVVEADAPCQLCNVVKIEVEPEAIWFAQERAVPTLSAILSTVGGHFTSAEPAPVQFREDNPRPSRAPPLASGGAIEQFREKVALRL